MIICIDIGNTNIKYAIYDKDELKISFRVATDFKVTSDEYGSQLVNMLKIKDISVLADYFVIADGTSSTQTRALADEVDFKLSEQGIEPHSIQGNNGSNWIVLDYSDIIVHVFSRDQREFYNLERLWSDGEEVDISAWLK